MFASEAVAVNVVLLLRQTVLFGGFAVKEGKTPAENAVVVNAGVTLAPVTIVQFKGFAISAL